MISSTSRKCIATINRPSGKQVSLRLINLKSTKMDTISDRKKNETTDNVERKIKNTNLNYRSFLKLNEWNMKKKCNVC